MVTACSAGVLTGVVCTGAAVEVVWWTEATSPKVFGLVTEGEELEVTCAAELVVITLLALDVAPAATGGMTGCVDKAVLSEIELLKVLDAVGVALIRYVSQ